MRSLGFATPVLNTIPRADQNSKALPFSRTIPNFANFSTKNQRTEDLHSKAQGIHWEFLTADEPITMGAAHLFARQIGSVLPHAYDLIFMCNFLTQPEMTSKFGKELRQLAQDLSPGGVMTILGGTAAQYPDVYADVRVIAAERGLTEISPDAPFDANREPHRSLVCQQIREYVQAVLATCSEDERRDLRQKLPVGTWNEEVDMRFPRYQVLAFVKQGKPSDRRTKKKAAAT